MKSLPVWYFPWDRRLWHIGITPMMPRHTLFNQPASRCFSYKAFDAVFEQMRLNRLLGWMASNIMQCIITRSSADVAIMSSVVCIIHKMLQKWGWGHLLVQSPAAVLLVVPHFTLHMLLWCFSCIIIIINKLLLN